MFSAVALLYLRRRVDKLSCIIIFKGLTPSCRRPLLDSPLGRSWRPVGRLLEGSGRLFGGSWSLLGGSWRIWESPGGILGSLGASWQRSGGLLKALGGLLGSSWACLEGSQGLLGAVLEGPRGLRSALGEVLGPCWQHIKLKMAKSQNLHTVHRISMIFQVPEASGSPPGGHLEGSWSGLEASWELLEAPGSLLAPSYGSREASGRPPGPDPRDIQYFPWIHGGAGAERTGGGVCNLTRRGPWGGGTCRGGSSLTGQDP